MVQRTKAYIYILTLPLSSMMTEDPFIHSQSHLLLQNVDNSIEIMV